jgi:hypothetical protein
MNASYCINHESIPFLDGDSDKFQVWSKKSKAFSLFSGFEEAIKEDADPNFPESFFSKIDLDTEEGMKLKLAKQNNKMTISCFTIAFIKEVSMDMVSRDIKKEWPVGLAHLIVVYLMRRYRPINTMLKLEMR